MFDAVKKRIAGLFAATALVAVFAASTVSPVFAKTSPSPPLQSWSAGSPNVAIELRDSKTPVDITSVKIVYNVPHFPSVSDKTDVNYRATVDTEYTLSNPTDEEITVKLSLQEQSAPDYFSGGRQDGVIITVGGEEISYGTMDDEMRSYGFYKPDTPVHTFKVSRADNIEDGWYKGSIIKDATKARYIASNYEGGFAHSIYNSYFYIVGDLSAVDFSAGALYNDNGEKINAPFEVKEADSVKTLKDFILGYKDKTSQISDVDYYNHIVSQFSNTENVCQVSVVTNAYIGNLENHYEYPVTIGPHGSVTTNIKTPVYPHMRSASSASYEYNLYGLRSGWNTVGKLEVEIITNYSIEDYYNVFQKTDTGYKAVYDSPERYFDVTLYEAGAGNNYTGGDIAEGSDDGWAITLLVVLGVVIILPFVAGGIALTVVLVKNRKKKNN